MGVATETEQLSKENQIIQLIYDLTKWQRVGEINSVQFDFVYIAPDTITAGRIHYKNEMIILKKEHFVFC